MLDDTTDTERALLGAMLLLEDAYLGCIPKLEVDDFLIEVHRTVFTTLTDMFEEGEHIDPVTVRRRSKLTGLQVHDLTERCPNPSNWLTYLKAVKRDAAQRRLSRGLEDARNDAMGGDTEMAVARIDQLVADLAPGDGEDEYDASTLVSQVLDHAEAFAQGSTAVLGAPSGWESLDKVIGGLIPGNFVIIAGRPGQGKSALAANLMLNLAKQGTKTVLFSLEMTAMEVGVRLMCREAKVNWESLRNGRVMEATDLMGRASEALYQLPFTVIDSPEVQVGTMRAACKRLNPQVIIVDYIQLMSAPGKDSAYERVSHISRGLKLLAKEMGVCVVGLAQLNRQVEMRGQGASPQLSDLRDSGSLEQDPDIIIFLRPKDHTELELQIAKNRNGAVKVVTLHWQRETISITEPLKTTQARAREQVANAPAPL